MRRLALLVLLSSSAVGCGVSREQYLAKTQEVQVLRQVRDEQAEQIRMLRAELTDLLVAIDDLQARKGLAEQRIASLQSDLTEAAEARAELAELNAQLMARHREILQLNEQLSTVWYNAALDRARRATNPEETGPEVRQQ
jgi:chromosome segregation ATPase